MARTLCNLIYEEPPIPIEAFASISSSRVDKHARRLAASLLAKYGLQLVSKRHPPTEAMREGGDIFPQYAYTMIGLKRLQNIQTAIETILAEGVLGDLIETGVWRGGATIFMRGVLRAYDVNDRRVFVADSFEGLPPPNEGAYPADKGLGFHLMSDFLAVSEERVRANFQRFGMLDKNVVFLRGFFKDTLPTAPIDRLALMRLDGDMYQSTIESLENLYPKLSVGGFCIIDDYKSVTACAKAVDDFRASNGVRDPLQQIDGHSVYWRKA